MTRYSRRTLALLGLSALGALPLVLIGVQSYVDGKTDLAYALLLFAAILALAAVPIRVRPQADVAAVDIPILAGVLLLPAFAAVPVAAAGIAFVDVLVWRRGFAQVARNHVAVVLSSGLASAAYVGVLAVLPGDGYAARVPAALAAALVYVGTEIAQLLALVRTLPDAPTERRTWAWVARTARAQLLWDLAAVSTIEVVRLEPLFLLPGVPIFVLGYLDIRARLLAERRARVLSTLVEVGHALGSSLDPTEVFRAVYAQVRRTLDADAFYVATADRGRGVLQFRFVVDEGQEQPAMELPMEGTLAGICVARDMPILLRDADRDVASLGLSREQRKGFGTLRERSIMVAPLRIRGEVIGAISAQSASPSAYDEGDLEMIGAIAREAAVAIERADLYDRTARLGRGLVDLHRIGAEIAAQRDLPALIDQLGKSVVEALGAAGASVYLDNGGDTVEFAASATLERPPRERSLAKASPFIGPVLATGESVEVPDSATMPEEARAALESYGRRALYVHALRTAEVSVGVLFVTWNEPHAVSQTERELVGVLAGIGATAIRGLRLYRELDDAYLSTVQALMTTILARDGYREDHQRRVAASAVALGERMGLGDEALRELRYAAHFYSLGKIAVPQSILAKAGPLTPEETRIVREHPLLGARILEPIRLLRGVMRIVRHANERWDGSGYPDGLAYEAIPYEARILQIAIVHEAMLADRPYRPALSPEDALAEMRLLAGTRFDPGLVSEFVAMVEARGAVIAAEHAASAGARELSILAEVTPEFGSVLDLQQLLDRVLAILARHFPGSRVLILLLEEQTGDLVVRAVAGEHATEFGTTRLPPGRGLSHHVLERHEAMLVDDVRAEPRWSGRKEARSALMVPLVNEGRGIGVLTATSDTVGAFAQRDLTLLQAVGAQIASAIEVAGLHERLKRAAHTDALTGLHNFRYFYDRLEEEVARAERRGAPLAVAYFDIDGLKSVNDAHGHLAGDAVLRALGTAIGKHVRVEDVPARYGGDEFAIVMPDTPRDEAEKVVARLMELLDRSEIDLPDGARVRMLPRSWGIAAYPVDGRTAKELVDNADTRVYARKRARS